MTTTTQFARNRLRGGTALHVLTLFGAGLALSSGFVSPAFAQAASVQDDQSTAQTDDEETSSSEIVVTGSILRTQKEDANPVTTIDATSLETRGVSTVEQAIKNLSADGAGTLPNSFTANGAFAAGASAASLRGLTTSSTLVLFDGLRQAYYPLADDGTRNFVDLNTIPDAVVERVEVLKDGASSTYGADAIAGVINVITKRQVTGLHMGAETGISERGDGATYRLESTYGFGDLDQQGFNVYVSGQYYKSDPLYNRDRGYPYNTDDYSGICNDDGSDCLPTGVAQGREFNGDFSGFSGSTNIFYSRPYDPATGTAVGGYELLNPAAGCREQQTTVLTPAELAAENAGSAVPFLGTNQMCQWDITNQYGVISPQQERVNGTIRATGKLSDDIEGYFEVNYARSDVSYDFYNASAIRSSAPAETGVTFNVSPLFLPVYICDGATPNSAGDPTDNGCNAGNGTLNPNNPYAAQGLEARVLGNLHDINESSRYKSDAYRASFGLNGSFGDGWYFDVGGAASKVELERTLGGRVYIANFLQAVADGSYNFVNPEQNSQAVRDFIAPVIDNRSTSELYQLQASVSRDLFQLPGGAFQIGVGGSIRHERVNAPGADSDGTTDPDIVDPTQRYTSRVNPFGSAGKRTVYSVYGEASAPFTYWAELNLSGRYDKYSTGQDYFSPKAALRINPIPQILLRGTFSKGFRIGSFAEFGATPTTGYVNGQGSIPENIQNLYKAANGGTLPDYITSYSLGLTQSGNPDLQPEKSENLTAGVVVEPLPGISFTVDYFQIKKKDLITGADYKQALAAYYAGQPIPEGFDVIADDPSTDPALAGLIPRAQFVQYSFTNKDSAKVRGIDFGLQASVNLFNGVKFVSALEGTRLLELSQTTDGVKQEYQGSIGPYVITSAAGSPKWRGNWQNTLQFDGGFISATAYYTDGYTVMAEDYTAPAGGGRNDCDYSLAQTYYLSSQPYQCSVDDFFYINLAGGIDVTDRFRFYVNVNNVFDSKPPIDTATYGGHLYNPAWGDAGIMGRYFKFGVKAEF